MRRRLLVLLALPALVLTACGSEGDGAPEAAASAAPAPKRVVALDFPSADAALALGVVPIAMAEVTYAKGGVQEWTKAQLGRLHAKQPQLINLDAEIPIERIAAMKPDVILAGGAYGIAKVRPQLERIAPVVTWKEGEGVDRWQDTTVRIGRALGREKAARGLVADVERDVAAARARHPQFDGATVSFFNFVQDVWVINSARDFSIRFLSELGLRLEPKVERLRGEGGRAQVSRERLAAIDADVIIGTSPSPQELSAFERSRLFREIPAVARGSYVTLDLGTATAMAFPSALSVRFAVRELVPQLAGAVRKP